MNKERHSNEPSKFKIQLILITNIKLTLKKIQEHFIAWCKTDNISGNGNQ